MNRIKSLYNSFKQRAASTYKQFAGTKVGKVINVMKNSVQLFKNHDTFTLGAALSYYMVFSIAPMMIIVISVAGLILGPEAVTGEIKKQIQNFVGAKGAEQLQDIIKAAYKPGENWISTTIASIVLIIGATGVFGQLRTSLNVIWDIKPHVKMPVVKFLIDRIFSFAMIVCLAFLLLVSLVIHAALAGFNAVLERWLSGFSVVVAFIIENSISLGVTVILFALIYKFMSDAKPRWRSVFWGGAFTAVLFAVGKYLIGLYIGKTNLADTYGAAGCIVLLLVWVFYSSQILFFGAEFTRGLAIEQGVKLDPNAQKPDHEAGISAKVVSEVKK